MKHSIFTLAEIYRVDTEGNSVLHTHHLYNLSALQISLLFDVAGL